MIRRLVQRALGLAALSSLVAACSVVPEPADAPVPPPDIRSELTDADSRVWVDRNAHRIVVLAGPYSVPTAPSGGGHHDGDGHDGAHQPPTPHQSDDAKGVHPAAGGHHEGGMTTPLIPVTWPVDGGFQGFTVRVFDGEGDELPRHLMHHLIAVNFERRQLVYPVAERLFGVGTETDDVRLPDFLEVPMARGDSLGVYAMWHNESGRDLDDVFVQIVMPYAPDDGTEREAVLPVYMDTNNHIGGKTSFDIEPGRTVRSYEFTLPVSGGLLAASGHLHDYGRSLRLEDAETGEVLVELESRLDEDGRIQGVETEVFRKLFGLLDDRIPLEAGRRYRIVGEYFNPTDETLVDGAMAHIVGLFAPSDLGALPLLDRSSPAYRKDVAALPAPRQKSDPPRRRR